MSRRLSQTRSNENCDAEQQLKGNGSHESAILAGVKQVLKCGGLSG
jgi:hypothetical protein